MLTPEIKKLHTMGFAVHLLQEKSKMPIGSGWQKGPRADWNVLQRDYRDGMNVGVRLGAASKIGAYYLAVIDCDVKSKEEKHVEEMSAKLGSICPEWFWSPVVESGRGNGSKHIYVLTKEPVSPQRLSQSNEKVKVHMPSIVKFSKDEMEKLTEKERKAGMHLRAAWEISLMGEGQQVVLPPSIHPDSGKPYKWLVDAESPKDFEMFQVTQKEKTERGEKIQDFKAVPVDLITSKLSDKVVSQIIDGDDVSDRSGALLSSANAMLKAGFSEIEILSVLTDTDNYLGAVAYEHTQSDSRERAAEWVRKYTLEKAKKETTAQGQFEGVVIEEGNEFPPEYDEEDDWRSGIDRTDEKAGRRPKNTLKNVILILRGEAGENCFMRNEFAHEDLYGVDAPWGGRKGAEVIDLDTVRIKTWLADNYRFEPSNDRINEAVSKIADMNRFNPVRDYLDGIAWDGVPRLDTWLKKYLSAVAPEPYLAAVSRKTVVAMIKRIYEPGCKFDYILILEGNQGVGKSTALKNLVSDEWFTDAKIDVGDKDSVMTMRSKWLIELGELSAMSNADVELMKAFATRTTDRVRVPYGKRAENFPRQCIFVGTTNREEYLKDTTGNRRFWPVKVGVCHFEKLKRDRDQILAEAKFAYELGEPIYLEEKEMIVGAIEQQEAKRVTDSFEETIGEWLDKADEGETKIDRDKFTMGDLFNDFGPLASWKQTPMEIRRAGEALRKLGFKRILQRQGNRVLRIWAKSL